MTKKKPGRKQKRFSKVKGTNDILPQDQDLWEAILSAGRDASELHDFRLLETPPLEYVDLFASSLKEVGTEEGLVTLKTKQISKDVALRPEGVSPIMRSYLENKLGYFFSPLRAYYQGPMFKLDPDGGGLRYFHQWGFEIVGDGDPIYDAEIVLVLHDFLSALKFKDPLLYINAVGCKVCRPKFRQKLKNYYKHRKKNLCKQCEGRFNGDPLRLFVCEKTLCRDQVTDAPIILDYLCQSCNNHFKELLELIEDNKINYLPDPRLVGKFDYYNKIAFTMAPSSDKDVAVASGGRHDYLSERMGGRQLPAVGGVIDIENLIEVIQEEKLEIKSPREERRVAFFVAVGKKAKKAALPLMQELRSTRIVVAESLGKKSLKAQLRAAERSGASLALIFGQKEVFENTIIIRDFKTSTQENVPLSKMLDKVREKI